MSCAAGRRRSLDPALLQLGCGLAAVAPIGPLAWEPPYAAGTALKSKKKKKKVKSVVQWTKTKLYNNILSGD